MPMAREPETKRATVAQPQHTWMDDDNDNDDGHMAVVSVNTVLLCGFSCALHMHAAAHDVGLLCTRANAPLLKTSARTQFIGVRAYSAHYYSCFESRMWPVPVCLLRVLANTFMRPILWPHSAAGARSQQPHVENRV